MIQFAEILHLAVGLHRLNAGLFAADQRTEFFLRRADGFFTEHAVFPPSVFHIKGRFLHCDMNTETIDFFLEHDEKRGRLKTTPVF